MGVHVNTVRNRAKRLGALERRGPSSYYVDLQVLLRDGPLRLEGSLVSGEFVWCRIKLHEHEAAIKRLSVWVEEVDKRTQNGTFGTGGAPLSQEKGNRQ